MTADIEKLSIDTIRCLAMDAVQKANAGHPGTAMALAPVAYVLYRERMRHDPADPNWPNRDRFVLSAGHACILQYAALHLSGYDLTLDDLKQFRQWGSQDARASRAGARAPDPGHRDHDRPARAGRRQRRRHGARRGHAGRALQPRRQPAGRPPHLRDLLRRRRHGGRVGRGELDRGLPRPGQALPDLRRQPHHDRGLDRASRSARTSDCATRPTASTSSGWTTAGRRTTCAPRSTRPTPRRRGRR